MPKSVIRDVLLLSAILSTLCFGQDVTHPCGHGNHYIRQKTELKASFKDMVTKYNETCLDQSQCAVSTDPVHTYLTYDFSYYAQRLAYSRLKSSCESRPGYKMCQVNTKTVFQDEDSDGEMNSYVRELNKPICFPPTCSLNQVGILDPTPATCNSSGKRKCQILNYEVTCPDDFSTSSDTSTCSSDALPPTSPFFMQRSLIEASAMTSCKGALSTAGSNSCSLEVGKSSVTKEMDWLDFQSDPAYTLYQKTCAKYEGQICYADLTVESFEAKDKVHNITFGDVVIRHKYENYPQCMPVYCRGEDLATIVIENYASENGINCDPYSNNCNVTVSSVSCLGYSNTLNKKERDTPSEHDFILPTVITEAFPSDIEPVKDSKYLGQETVEEVESLEFESLESEENIIPTASQQITNDYPVVQNNVWTFWHTFMTVSGIILFFTLISLEE